MRGPLVALTALMVGGCSSWLSAVGIGLNEAPITKISAPGVVKAGEPIRVTFTISEPTSCDTFDHLKVERPNNGNVYVFRALNREDLSQEGRCLLVESSIETVSYISGAPIGLVTLTNADHSIKTTVMVE